MSQKIHTCGQLAGAYMEIHRAHNVEEMLQSGLVVQKDPLFCSCIQYTDTKKAGELNTYRAEQEGAVRAASISYICVVSLE